MATHVMHGQPRRQLVHTVMEHDAALEQLAHHRHHVVFLEGSTQTRVAHAPTGAIRHLDVLHVVAGVREQIVVAAVVVVHVRQYHFTHVAGFHADRLQPDRG